METLKEQSEVTEKEIAQYVIENKNEVCNRLMELRMDLDYQDEDADKVRHTLKYWEGLSNDELIDEFKTSLLTIHINY